MKRMPLELDGLASFRSVSFGAEPNGCMDNSDVPADDQFPAMFCPAVLARWLPRSSHLYAVSKLLNQLSNLTSNQLSNLTSGEAFDGSGIDQQMVQSLCALARNVSAGTHTRSAAIRALDSWISAALEDEEEGLSELHVAVLQLLLKLITPNDSVHEAAAHIVCQVIRSEKHVAQLESISFFSAVIGVFLEIDVSDSRHDSLTKDIVSALSCCSSLNTVSTHLAFDGALVSLIAARRSACEEIATPAGWILCDLLSSLKIAPAQVVMFDIVSEVLCHASTERGREEVAWALATVAGKIGLASILVARSDIISFLLLVAQTGNDSSSLQATWALANLSSHGSLAPMLVSSGILKPLCVILERPVNRVQQQAARCLANLLDSEHGRQELYMLIHSTSDSQKQAMAYHSLFSTLLTLANAKSIGSSAALEPAARALAHACRSESLCSELVELPQLIPTLQALLEYARELTPSRQDQLVLRTIMTFAANLTSTCMSLPHSPSNIADLAPALVDLIGSEFAVAQWFAVESIHAIAGICDEHKCRIVSETSALPALRDLAQHASDKLTSLCEATIGSLAGRLTPGSRATYVQSCPKLGASKVQWRLTPTLPRRPSHLSSMCMNASRGPSCSKASRSSSAD